MDYRITDFGAVGDGRTLSTESIQRAIDTAAVTGGTVVVPEGRFLSGAIFLKEKVSLRIDGTLLGTNDISKYPVEDTRFEGHQELWPVALVNADGLSDFMIYGSGTVDGQGIPFYREFWDKREEAIEKCLSFVNKDVPRPRLFYIRHCSSFIIDGLRLKDAGFWNLHLYDCQDVVVSHISVQSPHDEDARAASTDGIDIDACQRVLLTDSSFAVDDDCICIKGGKGPRAHLENKVTKDIVIQRCNVGFGHGAITFGSEACLVDNVLIRDIDITGENQLVRFKFRADTDQSFRNITFENIRMESGVVFAIRPWINRQDEIMGEPLPSRIENLTVRGLVARNTISPGLILADPPLTTIENLILEDIDITSSANPHELSRHDNYEQERSAKSGILETCNLGSYSVVDVRIDGRAIEEL